MNISKKTLVFLLVVCSGLVAAQTILGDAYILGARVNSSFPTAVGRTGGLLYGTTTSKAYLSNGTSWVGICVEGSYCADAGLPTLIDSTYINNVTFATTTYGGGVLPAAATTYSAARFHIRTPGSGGTTNATIRISDGTNNCDCGFACNVAVGNYRAACTGTCAFAASASITYSTNSIGDCTAGPDIQGNVDFEGLVAP